jgi:hypothetical protein
VNSIFPVSRQLPGGYIISETLLRKCVQLAGRLSEENRVPDTPSTPTDISVTFKGGREVNSNTLDDVLYDSFIQSTKIDEIVISNGSTFILRLRRSSTPVSFRIRSDRSTIFEFEHDLLNELSSGKTWYNFHYYEQLASIVGVIAFCSACSILSLLTIRFMGGPTLIINNLIMGAIIIFLAMILIIVAIPDIIFDFGEGARRRKIRDYVLSGVILAAILGISVNFFTGWITGGLPPPVVAPSTVGKTAEVTAPVPAPFHLPENINEASNQDVRLLAYRLNQTLEDITTNYNRERSKLTGTVDEVALARLSFDDKVDREFRQYYEDSFLKLEAQLANRLKIDDARSKSFLSGRINIGDIDFAGTHLVDLANRLQ